MKTLGSLCLRFVFLFTLVPLLSGAATAPTLTLGGYRLVKITPVAPKLFDFSYKADVTNFSTTALHGLTLTLRLVPPLRDIVQAVDGELHFGDVLAEATVQSSDTFTLRRDVPVAPNSEQLAHGLEWSIAPNATPIANAGPDQTVALGSTVSLDGSASSDPDGDPLAYQWSFLSQPAGGTAALINPTAVNPSFVADKPGSYTVQLTVNDGKVDSLPDEVLISTQNSPPVANAGPDQTVFVGSTVTLDGSGSTDVDGDTMSYQWSLVSVPSDSLAALQDSTSVNATFTVDKPGSYGVQLVVNDGKVDSAPASVSITTQNSPPVARGGPDQNVFVGTTVILDGSDSTDVDGDPLIYHWSLLTIPADSTAGLSNAAAVRPTFTADKPGMYVAQVVVSDGTVESEPATVTVTTQNSPPSADAGPDQSALVGTLVTLDGSGSTDVDGDPLTFQWSLLSVPAGSAAALQNPDSESPSFMVDEAGTYVVQLIVNDGMVDSDPTTVNITTQNSRPVADAGPDQTAEVGRTVTLDGTASRDADNDPLTFAWALLSQPASSTAILTAADQPEASFVPDYVRRPAHRQRRAVGQRAFDHHSHRHGADGQSRSRNHFGAADDRAGGGGLQLSGAGLGPRRRRS
jgi:PKD domain/K319L-like, PKD domain